MTGLDGLHLQHISFPSSEKDFGFFFGTSCQNHHQEYVTGNRNVEAVQHRSLRELNILFISPSETNAE
jgi:hypothetical protein|tara:strand:- start:1021 stop:1224 length:204 start_codon:yes stop_codon:yes gene_type:complete